MMQRAASLALLLLLPAAAAMGDPVALAADDACDDDATCSVGLLQRVAQAATKGDACQCLNWKSTYAKKKAACGAGNEFYGATSGPLKFPMWAIDIEFRKPMCDWFFERLDNSMCANMKIGDHHETNVSGGTWCYVSKACDHAQSVANATVKTKMCGSSDNQLRSRTPEELSDMAQKYGLDLVRLVSMAYPLDQSIDWPSSQNFWGLSTKGVQVEEDKVPKDLGRRVQALKEKAKREIVAVWALNEYQPIGILQGDKVWTVDVVKNATKSSPVVSELHCRRGC